MSSLFTTLGRNEPGNSHIDCEIRKGLQLCGNTMLFLFGLWIRRRSSASPTLPVWSIVPRDKRFSFCPISLSAAMFHCSKDNTSRVIFIFLRRAYKCLEPQRSTPWLNWTKP